MRTDEDQFDIKFSISEYASTTESRFGELTEELGYKEGLLHRDAYGVW